MKPTFVSMKVVVFGPLGEELKKELSKELPLAVAQGYSISMRKRWIWWGPTVIRIVG